MQKRRLKIIAILLLTSLLSATVTGCYDLKEVSDELYAIMLGVDKGENNAIRLTVILPVYGGGGGGGEESEGGGSGSENKVYSLEAANVLEGLNNFNLLMSRKISLLHLKAVVFSEELAREGLLPHMTALQEHIETRNAMGVMVVKGTAEDSIKQSGKSSVGSLSKEVEMLLFGDRYNSYFPMVIFEDFYNAMRSSYSQASTIYSGFQMDKENEEEGDAANTLDSAVLGIAVFSGDKMIGSLNKYESAYYMMLRGEFKGGMMTFPEPEDSSRNMVIDIYSEKGPVIKTKEEGDNATLDIFLSFKGEIESIEGENNYESPEQLKQLNEYFAGQVQKGIMETIQKTQQYGSDIFGFGGYVAGDFAKIQDWEEFSWTDRFRDAKVNVSVKFEIVKTGTQFVQRKRHGGVQRAS